MRFGFSMRPRRGKIVPVPAAAPAAFPPPEPVKARVLPVRTWPAPGAPAPGRLTADGLERSVVGAMQGLSRNGREQLHRVAHELAAVEARGGIVCGVYVSTGPRVAPTPARRSRTSAIARSKPARRMCRSPSSPAGSLPLPTPSERASMRSCRQ